MQGFRFDTLGGAFERLPRSLDDLFSPVAFTICLQWLLFQILLDRILPGKVRPNTQRPCRTADKEPGMSGAGDASHVHAPAPSCQRACCRLFGVAPNTHKAVRRSHSCRTYLKTAVRVAWGFGTLDLDPTHQPVAELAEAWSLSRILCPEGLGMKPCSQKFCANGVTKHARRYFCRRSLG